jgi:hypothetical protein
MITYTCYGNRSPRRSEKSAFIVVTPANPGSESGAGTGTQKILISHVVSFEVFSLSAVSAPSAVNLFSLSARFYSLGVVFGVAVFSGIFL